MRAPSTPPLALSTPPLRVVPPPPPRPFPALGGTANHSTGSGCCVSVVSAGRPGTPPLSLSTPPLRVVPPPPPRPFPAPSGTANQSTGSGCCVSVVSVGRPGTPPLPLSTPPLRVAPPPPLSPHLFPPPNGTAEQCTGSGSHASGVSAERPGASPSQALLRGVPPPPPPLCPPPVCAAERGTGLGYRASGVSVDCSGCLGVGQIVTPRPRCDWDAVFAEINQRAADAGLRVREGVVDAYGYALWDCPFCELCVSVANVDDHLGSNKHKRWIEHWSSVFKLREQELQNTLPYGVVVRDDFQYCKLCLCWATAEHLKGMKHQNKLWWNELERKQQPMCARLGVSTPLRVAPTLRGQWGPDGCLYV